MIPDEAVEVKRVLEWGDGRNCMIADRIRARIKVRSERAPDGPWRRCITTTAKAPQLIPEAPHGDD